MRGTNRLIARIMFALGTIMPLIAGAAPHGGTGGSPFISDCGPEGAVIAVKYRANDGEVVSVQAVCSRAYKTGKTAGRWDAAAAGGTGGRQLLQTCSGRGDGSNYSSGHDVVVGISGSAGALVNSVLFHCAKTGWRPRSSGQGVFGAALDSSNYAAKESESSSNVAVGGSWASNKQFLNDVCPDGQVARAIKGRAGSSIDQIELVCHHPNPQQLAPTPEEKLANEKMALNYKTGGKFQAVIDGFNVLVEQGTVAHAAATATIQAVHATISPVANAGLKAVVKNATLIAHKTSANASTYKKIAGDGLLEFTLAGSTFTIPKANFETKNNESMSISGGDIGLRGCTHTVGGDSALTSSRLTLSGSLKCGSHTVTNSELQLASGVEGGGKLSAFGHNFNVTYATSGSQLKATGTWNASGEGWKNVPNVSGAQYRVVSPKVKVELTGSAFSAGVDAGKVETRTTATKPDGSRWATAQADPPSLTIGANAHVSVPLPPLPKPSGLPPTVIGGARCNASCSLIGAGLVSSGSGFSVGFAGQKVSVTLNYVDQWQGRCQISSSIGGLNGQCNAETGCPPGQEKFADGGVWKCRVPGVAAPSIPSLPGTISVSVQDLTQ